VISLSRRTLLKGLGAMPMALGLTSIAQATDSRIRYDLASAQGQQMLAIYADAVAKMQALGPDNPMSWMWQWYTHFVDGATTKADEINRIFGSTGSTLAQDTWDTCQSHSGQNANNFFPWHRLFVYYFERIVRHVSGQDAFTLPYWDYTSTDPAKRGVVPEPFRMPDDPLFASLYRPERGTLANSGQPIQTNQTSDVMDISDAMSKANYSTADNVQGFCRAIDSGIHGRIHVLTGTSHGMGAVPYACRDPLFWVHHSNIDRMWASWNRNGGKNPPATTPWATRTFVFADVDGRRVTRKLSSAFSVLGMGYSYDAFIPKPIAAGTTTMLGSSAMIAMASDSNSAKAEHVAQSSTAAQLGAKPVHVNLLPLRGTKETTVLGLDPDQPGKRTYLVVKDLHTWKQPEVLFDVYLTAPNGRAKLGPETYAGNINFFDAEFHDHGHGNMGDALGENFFSFDVTDILQRIARHGGSDAHASLWVTFVPAGTPTAGGKPLVSTIELVRQ
jgi:tyrosinase